MIIRDSLDIDAYNPSYNGSDLLVFKASNGVPDSRFASVLINVRPATATAQANATGRTTTNATAQ